MVHTHDTASRRRSRWAAVGAASHRPSRAGASLPFTARVYVASVIVAGGTLFVMFFPRQVPDPVLFTGLALFACVTSAWKVTLPLPVVNGSTLSVSYAANLMSLLLLGPRQAMLIAVAAFWTQCAYKPKHPYPPYRTLFSAATGALTMMATSLVFTSLGGADTPIDSFTLARPLVGAIATYFGVNTGLIACAIALSSGDVVRRDVAAGVSLERRQLHGRGHGWRHRRGGACIVAISGRP